MCGLNYTIAFSLIHVFYFFFQAEDGIRDLTVTGVQTCALPIFPEDPVLRVVDRPAADDRPRAGPDPRGLDPRREGPSRSEERRVGKECRSRWSPDHYKKKKKAI